MDDDAKAALLKTARRKIASAIAGRLLAAAGSPVVVARRHLEETPHHAGCQCHKCWWAHAVISGRVICSFEEWRG